MQNSRTCLAAMLLAGLLAIPSRDAFSQTPRPDKDSETAPAAQPAGDSEKSVAKPAEEQPAPSDDDPLDRAVHSMRAVQERIQKGVTDQQTRQLQDEIVADLDKLIELAKQSPPPSNQPSQPRPNQQPQPMPKPQSEPPQSPNQQAGEGNPSTAKNSDKAKESTDQREKQGPTGAELTERRRVFIEEVWGHLPASVRERMLNITSEQSLPKYDELVRRYFEALAEPASQRPRRDRE